MLCSIKLLFLLKVYFVCIVSLFHTSEGDLIISVFVLILMHFVFFLYFEFLICNSFVKLII